MIKPITKIVFIILSLVILNSCATIIGGKKNTISTKSVSPPEAKVYLDNKEVGQGVFKTRISKYDLQEGDILLVKSEGYKTDTIVISRKASPWYTALDFVSTLGVGLLLDVGTGNIYRPNTQKLDINLKEEGEQQ
jgi:hypothetical protein